MGINMDNRKAKPMKPAIHLEYFSKKVTHTSPCGLRASPIRYARGDWANSLPWGRGKAAHRSNTVPYFTRRDPYKSSGRAGCPKSPSSQRDRHGNRVIYLSTIVCRRRYTRHRPCRAGSGSHDVKKCNQFGFLL